MSYILDALKKAEAERHMGQVPGLHAQPAAALAEASPVKRSGKKILLSGIAVLLLAVGAALAWLKPWQAPPPAPDARAGHGVMPPGAAASQPAARPPAAVAAAPAMRIVAVSPPPEKPSPPVARPVKPRESPKAASAPKKATAPPASAAVASLPASGAAPAPAVTPAAAVPAIAPAKPASRQAAQVPGEAGKPDLKLSTALTPEAGTASPRELPEQIQRELPALAIGGYIYSDNPRERQLLVNRRLLHEGEEAAPGVVLETMLPKAAIFNYKGYRYRLAY